MTKPGNDTIKSVITYSKAFHLLPQKCELFMVGLDILSHLITFIHLLHDNIGTCSKITHLSSLDIISVCFWSVTCSSSLNVILVVLMSLACSCFTISWRHHSKQSCISAFSLHIFLISSKRLEFRARRLGLYNHMLSTGVDSTIEIECAQRLVAHWLKLSTGLHPS